MSCFPTTNDDDEEWSFDVFSIWFVGDGGGGFTELKSEAEAESIFVKGENNKDPLAKKFWLASLDKKDVANPFEDWLFLIR